ncbi:MAG TPA: XRE family transcriptional regulator [Alphaproteobacteria bacterium]|nr:XRE family transcriptional regulator [Alphaproteobacteria bacterium]HAJ47515.1 XRE family transcriptional regulator [Alphaproteobacteria bacterium]
MSQETVRTPRTAQRVDEHVGERIRHRRTVLGLTQEQLAQSLNISYQQLQKYETAANRVSAGRLYEIANKLEVDIGFFFEGLRQGQREEPMPHGGRNRIALDLVKNFMDISDAEIRSAVASLVKSLSENPAIGAALLQANGTEASGSRVTANDEAAE